MSNLKLKDLYKSTYFQAMKLMKNSNDSYRVTNCRSGELHTDQTIELEESIKNKLIGQKQLKRRMFELEQDIANIEYIVRKCQEEADTIKAFTEGNLKSRDFWIGPQLNFQHGFDRFGHLASTLFPHIVSSLE